MLPGLHAPKLKGMTRKSMARRRAGSPATAALQLARGWAAVAHPFFQRAGSALATHRRWSAAAVVLLALGLALSVFRFDETAPDPTEGPQEPQLAAVEAHEALQPVDETLAEVDFEEQVEAHGTGPEWTFVEVRPGQTLDRIFRDLGLSPGLLHQVVNHDAQTRGLARIRPGDIFGFELDADGEFLAMRADFDDESWLIVERGEQGLSTRIEYRDLETRLVEASGIISSSLFNAAKNAGMTDSMTMRLASIFGWDIDFALDIRSGDRFALVYEEVWRDGEFLRDGAILAARFVNQGETFEAIRFDAGDGPDFFSPDGRPMRQAFLRAPLNFTRVTSDFNPRRFHPITRQIRPHNGIDWGAPTGTPVWAAGDGRVIRSAFNNVNGNYIFIQHGNNIVTRYLHLSRRDVRQGDRVRQGQTIGAVGATGLATGPHLHYEFLVNGTHRNPRTVELPRAQPLPDDLMDEFRRTGAPLLAQLSTLQGPTILLAQRKGADGEDDDSDG